MKITYETVNRFEPSFLPGDKVFSLDEENNIIEITISSVECFYDHYRYNAHHPKETIINWFQEDYIDILDKREVYPASAVWSSVEKIKKSYVYWNRQRVQAEENIKQITKVQD